MRSCHCLLYDNFWPLVHSSLVSYTLSNSFLGIPKIEVSVFFLHQVFSFEKRFINS